MWVGIIASCMVSDHESTSLDQASTIVILQPSMSKSFKQFPKMGIWSSKLTSRLNSSWFSSIRGSASSSDKRQSKHKASEYKNMGNFKSFIENQGYGMPSLKSIQTFVHAGGPDEVEEDGIYLHYKIEQRSVTDEADQAEKGDGCGSCLVATCASMTSPGVFFGCSDGLVMIDAWSTAKKLDPFVFD